MEKVRRRLRIAQVILAAALVVTTAAHFANSSRAEDRPFWKGWAQVGNFLWRTLHGTSARLTDWMEIGSVLGVTAALLAAPFTVGLLHRAKPLLWIMRILATAFSGWFTYQLLIAWGLNRLSRETGKGIDWADAFLDTPPALRMLLVAFWIATVGFWCIPAMKRKLQTGSEGAVERG
ncbi:MAG: hypothetical protein QM755_03095 [Luteolibacter sp.]